jgi:hypothetical protein
MPINPGEHADLLRAIGRLLDREAAEDVHLANNGAFLTLSWRSRIGGADERHYEAHNLEELRRWAREARGDSQQGPRGYFADLLRTLGQDLDREGADFTQIVQEADGLAVTGSAGGRYLREIYYAADLLTSSQRRRAWRDSSAPIQDAGPPAGGSTVGDVPRGDSTSTPRRGPELDELMDAADGPLLRRMRQAKDRPDQG